MKRVSVEVAEALREAGYPQRLDDCVIFTETYEDEMYEFERGDTIYFQIDLNSEWIESYGDIPKNVFIECPTYLDVWLWLWREKKFSIDIDCYNGSWSSDVIGTDCNDPEEAIEKAIEYLVQNNLIK